MDEEVFYQTMNNYTTSTTGLLIKLSALLEGIRTMPEEVKVKYMNTIADIHRNIVELENIFRANEAYFSKEQILLMGKAHGRIESLMILIGLNVRQ